MGFEKVEAKNSPLLGPEDQTALFGARRPNSPGSRKSIPSSDRGSVMSLSLVQDIHGNDVLRLLVDDQWDFRVELEEEWSAGEEEEVYCDSTQANRSKRSTLELQPEATSTSAKRQKTVSHQSTVFEFDIFMAEHTADEHPVVSMSPAPATMPATSSALKEPKKPRDLRYDDALLLASLRSVPQGPAQPGPHMEPCVQGDASSKEPLTPLSRPAQPPLFARGAFALTSPVIKASVGTSEPLLAPSDPPALVL